MDNIFPPIKEKDKVRWKGRTLSQVSSKIQKNAGNIAITSHDNHNAFLSRPLPIYRREINTDNKTYNPRTSIKIDEINQPNGSFIFDPSYNCIQNNLVNVFETPKPNNQYELLNPNCNTTTTCINPVSNALKKVRSSSGVVSNQYYTSNEQYYKNRNFNYNNQFQQGEPSFSSGSLMNQNIYSSQPMNTCRKYKISEEIQNNSFSYLWIDGSPHDVLLPDGEYDVEKLNNEFKLHMIQNRHYYVNNMNQTKVFLMNIVYNSTNEKIQLQCILNNAYSNNRAYSKPPIFLYIGHDTVSWNQDISYNNILPGFMIPPSFSNAIGFQPGHYPVDTNRNSTKNYYIDSNSMRNIPNNRAPAYYKPNNTQFSQQGSVSAGSLITRKKYDAITKSGMSMRTSDSMNLQNSLAYNIPIHGKIKNKKGQPLSLSCNQPIKNPKCLISQTQTSASIGIMDIFAPTITPSRLVIDFTHTDISYVKLMFQGGDISYTNYYSKYNTQLIIPPTLTRELMNERSLVQQTPIEYGNLLPNTEYSVSVYPYNYTTSLYNHYIVEGNPYSTTFTTKSDLSNVSIGNVSAYAVDISFTYTDLSYVSIEYFIQDINKETVIQSKPIPQIIHLSDLLPNTYYTFGINPYNNVDSSNNMSLTNEINTLSDVSNVTVGNITATSMELFFNYTDLSYVVIERSDGITRTTQQYSKPLQIPIPQLNLIIDTGYIFSVTPYNNSNQSGITRSSDIQYTISSIENAYLTNINPYSMDVTFDYNNFSRISIRLKNDHINQIIFDSLKPFILPIHLAGLSADTIYYLEITPFNHAGLPGSIYYSDAIDTSSDVSNVTIGNISPYGFDLSFTYTDLSYVSVTRTGGQGTVTYQYSKSILSNQMPIHYSGLKSGVAYQFNVIPYNHNNRAGNTVISNSVYTLSDLSNVNILQKTDTTMDLSFTFTDLSYVIVTAINQSTIFSSKTYYKPFGQTITYDSLIPNKSYNFTVTPYNGAGIPGSTMPSNNTLYTLSNVNNVLLTNAKDTTIDISFGHSDLSYVKIQANIGNTMNNIGNIIVKQPLNTIKYTGLTPDVSYSFTVIPYNNINEPGTAVTAPDILYTLSNVNTIVLSNVTSTSIDISFAHSDLSYVTVTANIGNTLNSIGNIIVSKPFTTITYSGLTPDVSYSFTVTPYNHVNVPGVSLTYLAKYTLASVNNVTLSTYDISSIKINFGNSDLSYVQIQAIYGGNAMVAGMKTWNAPFSKPLIYGGLISDMCYNFVVTPFNHENPSVAGISVTSSNTIYTLTTLPNLFISNVTYNSMDLSYTPIEFSYVKIQFTNGTNRVTNTYYRKDYYNVPIKMTGLLSDTSYNLFVTPYNHADVSNTGIQINPYSSYTLSSVTNSYSTISDSSSIYVNFSRTDLSYITVQAYVGNTQTQSYGSANTYSYAISPVLFKGLQSDVSYSFIVTPYNHNNMPGVSIQTADYLYTLSNVKSVNLKNQTSSSIDISFVRSDLSYVMITANIGNTTAFLGPNTYTKSDLQQNYITFLGLVPDVSYSFNVIPYNHATPSVPGTAVLSDTLYTLSTVNDVNVAVNDSSSVQINFGNSTLSSVSIYANLGSTSTYYNSTANVYTAPFQKPIIFGGLKADASYSFVVVPYNHAVTPVGGVPVANTAAVYTWAKITSAVNLTNQTSSSIDISFSHSDLSFVTITANIGNTSAILGPNIYTKSDLQQNYITFLGLASDVSYSFNVIPYNHATPSVPGTAVLSDTLYTLSTVNDVNVAVNDSSSVQINFGNSTLSSVSIYANLGSTSTYYNSTANVYTAPFQKPIIFGGLKADASYSFVVVPYNHAVTPVGGVPVANTAAVYTWAKITSAVNLTNQKATSIDISFAHSDLSFVTITANIGNTSLVLGPNIYTKTNLQQNYITFYGLASDVSYSFNVIPYNHATPSVPGTAVLSSNTLYTWANITSSVILTNQKATSIDISFSHSDLSYVTITANIGNTTSVLGPNTYTKTDLQQNYITFYGLTSDVSYSFNVIPFNHATPTVPGTAVLSSATLYTWAAITSPITIKNQTSSSIDISFAHSDLSFVTITANIGNTSLVLGPNTYTQADLQQNYITFYGLASDVSYSFNVIPYNHALPTVPGTAVLSSTMYTLSKINSNVALTNQQTTSIDISFTYSDLSYVSISANIGNTASVLGSNIYSKSDFGNYITFMGLTSDVSYSFNVTPYNHGGNAGIPVLSNTTEYTLSSVSSIQLLNPTSKSIDINFIISDFSYVFIRAIEGGYSGTTFISNVYSKPITQPITFLGLTSGINYAVEITPYNHANRIGAVVPSYNTIYTLSKLDEINLSNPTSTSVDISFTVLTVQYVSITANIANTTTIVGSQPTKYYPPFPNQITFTGLSPDISYNFNIIPVNNQGTPGNPVLSPSIYTLSTVNNVNITNATPTSIDISFSHSDLSYVSITANIGNTTSILGPNIYSKSFFGNYITFFGLASDVSYSFNVTPFNHALPSSMAGTAVLSSSTIYTSTIVSNVTLTPYDSSSIQLNYNYSKYAYVKIQANIGSTTTPYATANTYSSLPPILFKGLPTDASFTFVVTPYNDVNTPGTFAANNTAVYTLSTVANVYSTPYDASSIQVYFDKSGLSYVTIQANVGSTTTPYATANIYSSPFTIPILFKGLQTDASYSFMITPYNHGNQPGISQGNTTYGYTLSTVSNVTVTVVDSSSIQINFENSDLSYVLIQANIGNTTRPYRSANIYSKPFTKPILFQGLLTDVSYTFYVAPYNHGNKPGVTVGNYTAVYTLSTIDTVTLAAYDSSSIQINFGNSDLSYVSIQANIGSTTQVYGTANIYSKPFVKPILFQGLKTDTSYTFIVTPYNHGNKPGVSLGNYTPVYTLSTVNNVALSVVDSTSINVNFGNSDLYYVKIQANIGNTNNPYATANTYYAPFTTPILFKGLQPDVSYTFIVTPYNHGLQEGVTQGNFTAVYTLSTVNTVFLTNIKETTIDISFGHTDLSYVSITANIGNTVSVLGPNIYTNSDLQQNYITFMGLTSDLSYSFNVTPYNHGNIVGTPVLSSTTEYTLSAVSSIQLSNPTSRSIDINFTISDFSFVFIRAIAGGYSGTSYLSGYYYKPITQPITFTGLTPGINYAIEITPFNNANQIGTPTLSNNTLYTLSKINDVALSNPTSTSVDISFSVLDVSYVNITANIGNTNTIVQSVQTKFYPPFANQITYIGLSADTSYNFNVIPVNKANNPGLPVISTSIYTLSTITSNVTITNQKASSIDISFAHSDLSFVTITANIGNTTTILGSNTYTKADLQNNYITFYGLAPDVSYSFMVTPYNHATPTAASGIPVLSSSTLYTWSNITSDITITNQKATSIDISFAHSDLSYVTITANIGNTSAILGPNIYTKANLQQNYITFYGLASDVSYSFNVIPYNHATPAVPGTAVLSSATLYTLANITSAVSLTNQKASSIDISFAHSDLSFVTITANIGNTTTILGPNTYTKADLQNNYITFYGLASDVSYSFNVIPYNHATPTVPGTAVLSSATLYTWANITSAVTITNQKASSIDISFAHSDLSYVTITANIGNTTSVLGPNTYTKSDLQQNYITFYGLSSDVSYSFNVIPYNHATPAVSGTAVLSSATLYTLANITSAVSLTNQKASSIDISFAHSDLSFVTITANIGNTTSVLGPNTYTKSDLQQNYITFLGLAPDVSYSFNVIPYNHATPTVPGTAVLSSATLYTWANITSAVILTNQKTTSIDISFAHSDLSFVTITANIGNTSSVLGPNTYTKTDLQQNYITFYGLTSDVSYSFNVIPFNHATPTVPGTAVLSSTTLYTLANITSAVSLTNQTGSSIDISFAHSDLSYVTITANIGNTTTVLGPNTYTKSNLQQNYITFLGLASDVSYSFNVIPYNHATPTVPGTAILSSTTLYTLSTVNTVTLAVNDSSSIQINFGNSNLSSVSIYANLGSTSTYYNSIANVYVAPFQKPIIFQGLQPDASYTFVVVPYNHDGIPVGGVPIANTTAIYTWSYISNAIMGANAYAYGLDVSFNYTDLSYVTIAGTGVPLVKYYKPQITSSNYIHISNLAANTNYSLSIIPYNFSGVAGVTLVSPSYTTIYDISNVRMVNLSGDEIDISFNFASDVSYVKVTRANGVSSNIGNYQNVPFSTIQQTGLLPDTSYNFTLTPYNVYNITGGNQVLSNIYTLSTILSTTIGGNKYAYGIDISFIHSDLSYVTIQANANGSLVGAPLQYTKAQLVTANVQIANLTANTSYTLNIIPYNNIGNAGATSITGTYITSYDISNLRVISLSGDEIDLSFNFASDVSYINILRANGLTSNVGNYQNVPFTKIINTGLSADTSYNFTVTPYNKYNLPGIQQTINNYYTLSTVRNVSFVVNDSSSISVNFAYSNFSNVVIQANIGSTNTAFGSNIFYSPPFIFNGLAPDTSYNFMVTPYNDALVAGIPQGNTTVIYTYSYLNNVTLAVYDTSSININFANSDLSYVTIRANIGGSTVQYGTSANTYIRGFTKPILFKGLQPDVSYSFVVTPYNHANIAGFSLVTASTEYTWSSVSGVYYNVYDSSSIAIYFGNTDLSYVSIQANIGSTSSVVGSNIYSKGFTSPIIFNGLSTDASYSFSVTPYNHKNVAGNIVANTTAVYTLSYVNNVIISVNDSSSILIDFSNSDLSYVTIRANIGGTTTQYGTSANTYSKGFSKPILFTGLQQDASYSFVVTPYNHATTSVAGTPVVSSTKYTLATLPNLFISNVTSTSMDLSFTPVFDFSYASIQITNGTNVVTNNYYRSSFFNLPITLSGLTTDTSYSLVVTPYNHTGVANTPVSINSNNVSNIYLINNKIFNDPGLDYIVRKKSPWGIYDAALWTGTTLPEARGNGRTVTSTGTITSSSASGNGATVSIPYIYGDTTTTMSWPSGSIPTNFTICSISRYTGGTNKRILVGKNSNWLHGHWSNNRGVAFYQGWKTNQTSYGNLTDWLVMCGNNGSTIKYSNLEDSNPVGIASGGQGNDIFGINNCSQTSGEQSTWQLSYVMIWDQVLTDAEMLIVSKALQNYLSTGVIYKTPDNYPIYTLSTASSLIATYIAYNEIDISFNYSDLSYIFITSSPEITTGGNITPQLISKANISLPIRYTGLTTGTNYTFNVIPYNHGSQSGNTVSLSNYTSYILGNVVAQYDTSPSNIILSGSNVTRWNCINSATYNFTTSSAAGTVTTFTYNGLNMLNLTSNIATLGSASIACNGFISVINPKNNGTGGIDMLLSVSTTGDTSFRHARLSTTGSRNANDYDNSTSSYIYINGTYYPYTSQNYDNTDRYVILYVNFATSISFTTIGSTLFSRGFKGYIGDLICLNSSHTTNDRLALEGYLATKWNLQGSLPTNHPYYTLNQSIVFAYTPSISSVTTTNINYHSIDISFSQVNTSYIRIVSSPSVTLNSSYSGTSPITISGLTMGTAYVFTLTPYNLADTAGTPVATPSATTLNPILSVVATSSIGLYSTNITFTQIDTSYILISSTPSVSSLSNPYSTTSPISISGLTYNTAYTFYLTPYNSSNEPGSQVSTSITTLRPTITGVSTTTTTTSINISFSQSNVSYINITSNPTLTLNNPYNNPISPIVISGLSVDTSYNFTLTPYTSIGEPGSQVSIPTTYTLSYVNPVTITANDASSMNINFTSSDLSYVTIRANIGGTATQYGTTANIYSKGYSMPIVFSGLNIDSSYSFVVTPYNHATTSVAGTPIISSTTEYTLATLPNLFVTNVTSTSMDLSFTPVFDFSYASVKINNGVPTKYYRSSFFNLPITLSGLTTDTSYSLVVTPYNHTGVANTPVSLNTSKPYFTNIQYNNTSLNSIVQNISPWGIYDAALWNPTTNILPEARGNGRDVTSTGTITNGKASGNGATASVPYIYGDTTTTMSWPSGSIPTNFTICSISRYTGGTNNRILVAKNYNWLHGHHGGSRGRAYYNGWKTNQTSYGTLTDWLVMCGNNGTSVANSILEDSNPVGISSGGQGNDIFGINNCSGINEQSTWQLSYVIIWDQVLTDTDMLSVSNALLNYLSTGILYSNNSTYYTPIYTLSTISNLISTYITYNEIDISFNYSDLSYVYITSNPQITTGGNITPQTISKANIRLPIRYTGLTGTTTYSFNLTPYNHGLINCITVSNSYPTLTLPLLSSVSTNISINSIDISFTPSNVSYINISSSPSVSLNSSYGNTSPITITGLTVNSSYTFTLTPYASDNQVGTAVNISFTTLPYINTQSNAITSTETYSGNNYYIVKFTSSGSVKFNSNMNANVLIVGGGGYGGVCINNRASGGGGGGEVKTGSMTFTSGNTYSITIGTGSTSISNVVTGTSATKITSNIDTRANVVCYGGGNGTDVQSDGAYTLAIGGGNNGGGGGGYNSTTSWVYTAGSNGQSGINNVYNLTSFSNNAGGLGGYQTGGGGGGGAGGSGGDYVSNNNTSGPIGGAGGAGYTWLNGNTYAYGGRGFGYINTASSSYTGNQKLTYGSGGDAGTSGHSGINGIVIIAIRI